ncbi:MAG: DUF305 domain-containing protein [Candidatus Moraniibacteriota bacterium]
MNQQKGYRAYFLLAAMLGLHFVAMYAIMYSMVDGVRDIFLNRNNLYMAALMSLPMLILEILLMRSMYANKGINWLLGSLGTALFVLFFVFMRQQVFIDDREFLRSMIPHHSGAILMCEQADLEQSGVQRLCADIVRNQHEEIDRMKALLSQMEGER